MSGDVVDWAELGFDTGEAADLDLIQIDPDSFPLTTQIVIWRQWVSEIDSKRLLTVEEVASAWSSRDELDRTLAELPDAYKLRLYAHVDELDLRYRSATICVRDPDPHGCWWRGRVPVSVGPRFYYFGVMDSP